MKRLSAPRSARQLARRLARAWGSSTAEERVIGAGLQALDKHEPMNAQLYFRCARPFARLAGRNPSILALTLGLTEKACKLAPNVAEYAAEPRSSHFAVHGI